MRLLVSRRASCKIALRVQAAADTAPQRFGEFAKRDMPSTVSFLECGGLAAAFCGLWDDYKAIG
jgi:hypothetical protein